MDLSSFLSISTPFTDSDLAARADPAGTSMTPEPLTERSVSSDRLPVIALARSRPPVTFTAGPAHFALPSNATVPPDMFRSPVAVDVPFMNLFVNALPFAKFTVSAPV